MSKRAAVDFALLLVGDPRALLGKVSSSVDPDWGCADQVVTVGLYGTSGADGSRSSTTFSLDCTRKLRKNYDS